MSRPTEPEIEIEIVTLKAMQPKVRHHSALGDNNRDAINAQIEVLENRWDESDAEDNLYDQDWEGNVRDCAVEAAQWLAGYSEDGAPSKGWEPLLQ